MYGEQPFMVAACAKVMRDHALKCPLEDVTDIVGTGGDGHDTFNVSTAAAIVGAACGLRVAKVQRELLSSIFPMIVVSDHGFHLSLSSHSMGTGPHPRPVEVLIYLRLLGPSWIWILRRLRRSLTLADSGTYLYRQSPRRPTSDPAASSSLVSCSLRGFTPP